MRRATISTSGVSTSAPHTLDYKQVPFCVGFGCVVTGSATYTVQHTFDDISTAALLAAATWFDHGVVTGKTTSTDGNYAFPVTATRINQTASAGSVVMTILQGEQR